MATQRLQTEQCLERTGRRIRQVLQNWDMLKPSVSDSDTIVCRRADTQSAGLLAVTHVCEGAILQSGLGSSRSRLFSSTSLNNDDIENVMRIQLQSMSCYSVNRLKCCPAVDLTTAYICAAITAPSSGRDQGPDETLHRRAGPVTLHFSSMVDVMSPGSPRQHRMKAHQRRPEHARNSSVVAAPTYGCSQCTHVT